MRLRKAALTFAAAVALAHTTPAFADEPLAVTPSGATEAYFALGIIEASDLLANQCLDLGWTMVSSTETTVVCEVPVSFGNRLLSALAGPRYATPPRQFFRFNLAGAQGYTRAQASSWQEIQTAFGQTQRTDLQSENYHNGVMGFFQSIGGLYPPNTQFPNHAAIETDYEFVEQPRDGMLLTGVREGGPFARAGLQDGDIVTRIARERIKDNNDVSDGLHKAIRSDAFEVEFYRGSEKTEVMVPLEFRSTTGPLPERAAIDDAPMPSSTTIVQNEFSVAEELARFAELRDQGILTEEEFQAQKERLLTK
jgi:membrane-associated protease RseP (regulator of RpoE activity)